MTRSTEVDQGTPGVRRFQRKRLLGSCVFWWASAWALLVPVHADELAAPSEYKAMPWHLVDVWWDVGQDTPFESYSIDVTIKDPVPADINLYIAPIGLGHLNGIPFYGGLQTQADGYTKQNRRLRKI
ncbi:MAG: hypothetical protein ABGX05_04550, partial [Pirellulaceae bacterium]